LRQQGLGAGEIYALIAKEVAAAGLAGDAVPGAGRAVDALAPGRAVDAAAPGRSAEAAGVRDWAGLAALVLGF
jgi:hypothetical protein